MRCLLLMCFMIGPPAAARDVCSGHPGYTNYGSSCYKLYTSPKTWADAEAACVADGGHLASIHSSEEQEFIKNLLTSSTWIGLSDGSPNMAWSDNREMVYKNWCPSEPNGGSMHCGRMKPSCSYEWSDMPCSHKFHYVCSTRLEKRRVCFTKIPTGVIVDSGATPSMVQSVKTELECARRCHQDAQCVHFILSEDGGKYLCETYSSLYRPQTTAVPTNNYLETNC